MAPIGPQARYGWMAAGRAGPRAPDSFQRAVLEFAAQQLSATLRERHLAELRAADTALRQGEERFRSAFEHAAVGMALLTAESRFVQVNPALCRILGRQESQLLGSDWASVTHPEDVPRVQEAIRQLLSGERDSVILVKRGTHPSGTVVWVQNSLSLTRDADGRPGHLVALIEDITDQKRAEEALRLSEARFSRLFRHSPAALAMGTLRDGRMVDVNDRWLELFGYERGEVIGRKASELRLWADPEERAGVIERLARDGIVREYVTRFRRKSGEIRDALLTFVRTEVPGEPEPVSLSMLLDMTERRRAEVERARLDSITDATLPHLALNDLLRELLARLRSALRAEVATLRLVDEEAGEFVIRAADGVAFELVAGIRIPLDSSFPVRLDSPFIVNDLPRPDAGGGGWYTRAWAALGLPLRATIGVPLVVEGKQIGVLSLAATRTPFTGDDLRLLRVVADRVAPAIERGRLLETLGESHRRLAALSRRLVDVQETERREVARELHDQVGQLLTGLLFMIEGHGKGGGDPKEEMQAHRERPHRPGARSFHEPQAADARRSRTAVGAHLADRPLRDPDQDLRALSPCRSGSALRPPGGDHGFPDRAGGPHERGPACRREAGQRGRLGELHVAGCPHRGPGPGIRRRAAALAAGSSGLEGLRERSRLVGGHVAVESEPGTGTRVTAELPLDTGKRDGG